MLAEALKLGLDRVRFASACGLVTLEPWQREVLRSDSKRLLLVAARQSGKSTIAAARALHRALYYPGSLVLVFSPSQDQSIEFFRRVVELWDGFAGETLQAERLTLRGFELENRSRIEARPGNERTARGRTAHIVIHDEAALVPDELYAATRPMLAVTGGELMLLSTPKGRRGFFFKAYSEGTEWEKYFVPYTEVGHYAPGFIQSERRENPERYFAEEYECAFLDPEASLFTEEMVRQMFDNDEEALRF